MEQENRKCSVSDNEKLVMQVSGNSLAGNILLSVFKLSAGLAAHSGAMVSDAVHSISDVFSTIVVMIGFHLSEKEPDEEHPYGHERLECVAAILLAAALCATGAGIGAGAVWKIAGSSGSAALIPGPLALAAAVVSIAVKEGMYWYTRTAAQKVNSAALMADAWHHRSDALSSVGSFLGIAGAQLGYPVCDPLASVVISVLIVKASVDIFRDAVGKMTDRACSGEIKEAIQSVVGGVEGVKEIDQLQTRIFGSKIYVDVEIAAAQDLTLMEAHRIAEEVHDMIEAGFGEVKHCMVHVNPYFECEKEPTAE